MRVLITRPRERALELARALERRGDTPLIEPLLTIEPVAGVAPELDGVQAIVLTSAHAVPALSGPAKALPVFAVGDATAAAARRAGCGAVISAGGAAADLARSIAAHCRSGRRRFAPSQRRAGARGTGRGAGGGGFRPASPGGLSGRWPRTRWRRRRSRLWRRGRSTPCCCSRPALPRIFVELIGRHGLQERLAGIAAICLSAAVAQPCREIAWRAIHLAARPELGALLEALEAARRR